MFRYFLYSLLLFSAFIYGQSEPYRLSLENIRYIDSTSLSSDVEHGENVMLFDIFLRNGSEDTLEYNGGQVFLQVNTHLFNDGDINFYLLDSEFPQPALFSRITAVTNMDTVILCCFPKKPAPRGHGCKITSGHSAKLGTFELKTSNIAGFNREPFVISWRSCFNSSLPFTGITINKKSRLTDVSRNCTYGNSSN